jgi:hypothetical protein
MENIPKQESLFMTDHSFGVPSELVRTYIEKEGNILIAGIITTW